jgi:hypothetical protein
MFDDSFFNFFRRETMKARLTLIAAAMTLALGVAHANGPVDPALIKNTTIISNQIAVEGKVAVAGNIKVGAEAASVTDNSQDTTGNKVSAANNSANNASVDGGAGAKASGNIGVNISAGAGNAQANQTAISKVDAKDVFASAQNFSTQNTNSNLSNSASKSPNNAVLSGGALAGASGNLGVNVAAGAGNAQGNATAISAGDGGVVAKATSTSKQTTSSGVTGISPLTCDGSPNTAVLGGGALAGATGNIGVNVAAGAGNAQYNSLAIATAVAPCSSCK